MYISYNDEMFNVIKRNKETTLSFTRGALGLCQKKNVSFTGTNSILKEKYMYLSINSKNSHILFAGTNLFQYSVGSYFHIT